MRVLLLLAWLSVIATTGAHANSSEGEDKVLSGMSIVGNDEAPKALVIVPWKSSEMGQGLEFSRGQSGERNPVDREVFMRQLRFYAIRAGAAGVEPH